MQDDTLLHVTTRTFAAPRELVFRAWTDPAHVARWWGVRGATNPVCEMDVRPGGRFRIDMRTGSGTTYPNRGVYREVVPNERIVYEDEIDPDDPVWNGDPPPAATHTITFADAGPRRTAVSIHTRFATIADRDRYIRFGIREGIGQGLDRLEALLAELVEAGG